MKTKVCPCCDQPITGIYCKGCRKIVLKPAEREITYFLNTRHPAFETDCSFHNDLPQGTGRSGNGASRMDDGAVRSAAHKMTASETEAKKAQIKARLEARVRDAKAGLGGGAGTDAGARRQNKADRMMQKQRQMVLNGEVVRSKKTASGALEGRKTRAGLIAVLTSVLVIFVILFTFVMILVINSMDDVTVRFTETAIAPEPARETPLETVPAVEIEIPAVTISPELEALLKEAAELEMELPTPRETQEDTMEDWELTDASVREAGVACNGYGHLPVAFETVSELLGGGIVDAGYGYEVSVYSYNQFIDEMNWYETVYEYTIRNEEVYAGFLNVNVDTATGEIHGIEMFAGSEREFFEIADIAMKFMEIIGMASDLPSGAEFFETAYKNQGEAGFCVQNDLEVVCYAPETGEEYSAYHMLIYAPGHYLMVE